MNNFNQKIKKACIEKNNRLCLGLDVDNKDLKNSSLQYMQDFIFDIIDTTIDLCPIYKINFSFYERHGSEGYKILENISKKIDKRAISIADAKRGDIGNSSKYYAESIFEHLNYDSITVSPYMGEDSLFPFIEYDKGVFILCLTSNKGSNNLKKLNNKINLEIYKHVIQMATKLNIKDNIGLVVGATNEKYLEEIKSLSHDLPWLMPGVGFQGGNLNKSIQFGEKKGLSIVNVSRGILNYLSGTIDDIRIATENYTKKIREIL